jgi:glycosyltransferase involved in cell wall biosynthesis
MKLTVAICTWNRSELLQRALQQLTLLSTPNGVEWELLVVNNNSTDATDAVVRSFDGRLPVRLLFEPTAGKGSALNVAVREARGDYLLFIDDDVLVEPDWMAAYHAAFRQWPEAVVFGGTIAPWFEGDPPDWMEPALSRIGGVYAVLDAKPGPIRLTDSPLPFGANMAIRTDVQRLHPYDPRLGPRPGRLVGGEETRLIRTLLSAGLEGRWIPEARVAHYIPKQRQSIRYLRKFFFDRGAAESRSSEDGAPRRLFSQPLWVWRQAFEREALYWVGRAFSRPERWVTDLQLAATAWGGLLGPKDQG